MKGHVPVRIVMSQTCNLPEEANLWNVHEAYTIVATQRGARRDFKKKLAMKGVEVVEFDMLNPRDVMSYCYDRGYLSVLWVCGGTISAAAISARVIQNVYWRPLFVLVRRVKFISVLDLKSNLAILRHCSIYHCSKKVDRVIL